MLLEQHQADSTESQVALLAAGRQIRISLRCFKCVYAVVCAASADEACGAAGADGDDAASVVSKAHTACSGASRLRATKSSSPSRQPGAPGSTISSGSTAAGRRTGTCSIAAASSSRGTARRPGRAAGVRAADGQQHAGQGDADGAGAGRQPGFSIRHVDQLLRALVLLSQVGDTCDSLVIQLCWSAVD